MGSKLEAAGSGSKYASHFAMLPSTQKSLFSFKMTSCVFTMDKQVQLKT